MQIHRIEVRLGVTINTGDFQSVKAEMMAAADIDRNEDPMEAHAKLTAFVRDALVNGANVSHPDQVRLMLKKDARFVEAAGDSARAAVEAPKRGRPPKPAQAPAETAPETAPAKLSDTTGMNVGGLDKEDELTSGYGLPATGVTDELSDLDDLLGDAAKAPVTKEDVHAALTKLNKKVGKAAILEIFKKYGAASISQLAESAYVGVKRDAEAILAKTG